MGAYYEDIKSFLHNAVSVKTVVKKDRFRYALPPKPVPKPKTRANQTKKRDANDGKTEQITTTKKRKTKKRTKKKSKRRRITRKKTST